MSSLVRFADGENLPAQGDILSHLIWRGRHPRHRLQAALRKFALTHPQFTRAGIGARFEQKLSQVGRYADAILTNSNVSKKAICDRFYPNPSPPCHVLYPGLDHAKICHCPERRSGVF